MKYQTDGGIAVNNPAACSTVLAMGSESIKVTNAAQIQSNRLRSISMKIARHHLLHP
ncbi:hypothetical protein [Pseudomonas baetica]|uniref:hypothetical protein n=1 Tax=Pseudomonas baetica TaxID=674054 RepID=UPI0012FE214D|nr:hypothetical protein [Pseudomonas baetica]